MKDFIFLSNIQSDLEEVYGAHTGLNVLDFLRTTSNLKQLGTLLVDQSSGDDDLNVALLLDRDILAAWNPQSVSPNYALSVTFEEVSHFVYLSFNHNRKRNITPLEMEIQSEVDRIWLAFHGGCGVSDPQKQHLLDALMGQSYSDSKYEEARVAAANFIRSLSGGNPNAWTPSEIAKLRDFFHSDLSGKLNLAKRSSR